MLVDLLILDVVWRSTRKMKRLNILPRTSMLSHSFRQGDVLICFLLVTSDTIAHNDSSRIVPYLLVRPTTTVKLRIQAMCPPLRTLCKSEVSIICLTR